jgi:hypothetical protein
MAILIKFVVLVFGLAIGVALIKYNFQLTRLFGHNSLAERYLGEGGTYTMWKLLGVALIIGAVIYVF